jgi:trimeric autotransporter adhesin
MTTYNQNTTDPDTAIDNLAETLASLTAANISSSEMIDGGLRIVLNNGYYVDLQGSNLAIVPLAPSGIGFTGDVTQLYYKLQGTVDKSFTIAGINVSLQTLFTTPTQMFNGDDFINGSFGANVLYGYGGNDVLNGGFDGVNGAVQDTLYGGGGNDTFKIIELPDQADYNPAIFGGDGTDTISINWVNRGVDAVLNMGRLNTAPVSIEKIQFYNHGFVDGADVSFFASVSAMPGVGLLALPGLTHISGVKIISAAAAGTIDLSAVAIEDEGGSFRYFGTDGNNAFFAPRSFTPGTDVAYYGYGGNDTLGGFADVVERLYGGSGNDTYIAGAGDVIQEDTDQGNDTIQSRVSTNLNRSDNIENLTLVGNAAVAGTGNALANRITGNDAANRLDGGLLADRLIGGNGDDTYVYGTGDVIVEAADGGNDRVESAVTATLAANVERLVLTGALAINGTGNAAANRITGNDAANRLDGAGGIDTLIGGDGNDTYIVDNAADVVTEVAGDTDDTVRTSVDYVLAASANIETLAAAAGTVAIDLTGNALAQEVIGNGGANVLNGLSGADTLTGGAGADTFVFSAALATTGLDVITDFSRAMDIIHLQNGIFLGLGAAGALASAVFTANTTGLAGDTSDRIIYETDTGILRYDSNGSAAGGTIVQVARLQTPLALDHTDFMVI